MKKLMGFVGVVLAAVVAYGQVEPVPSVNVVGYAKLPQPPGLDLKSAIFYVMSGNNTLGEILGANGVANSEPGLADNVYTYDPIIGYTRFWLFDGSAGPEYDHKWIDPNTGEVATNSLIPGQGFWVKNRSTTTNHYAQLGEAVLDPSITIIVQPGMQILAYPYSADIEIGKLTCTNGVANSEPGLADNLYTYDSTDGFKRYWLYDASAGPEYNRKWIDPDTGEVAVSVLKAGQAFWLRSRSTGNKSWTEDRPYLNN